MKKTNGLLSFFILFISFTTSAQDDVVSKATTDHSNDLVDSISSIEVDISGVFGSQFTDDFTISQDKIANNRAFDATKVMQSQLAGLSVLANSYSPGASSSLLLRGHRSLNGSNQPLILLNGIPIDNSEWNNVAGNTDQSNRLLDIDPNNIESIDVIKSSARRAKYGIVGGNGVILIKTKKGFKSKPTITFKSTVGIDQVSNLPALQNTYAPGRTFNGLSLYRGPETRETSSWGPLIDDLVYDGDSSYPYDGNGRLIVANGASGTSAIRYDPYSFFDNGMQSNQSLNISGGSNKVNYIAIIGANNQQGVIPTTEYNRYNFSSTVGVSLTNKLSLQLHAALSRSDAQRNYKGSNLHGVMLGLLRTPFTFDNANGFDDPINNLSAYALGDNLQRSATAGRYDNPYWTLNKNKHTNKVNRQLFTLASQYSLTDKLDLLLSIGHDHYLDMRQGGTDINPGLSIGDAFDRNIDYSSQNVDLSAHYAIVQSNLWDISSSIGISYNQSETAYQLTEGTGLKTSDNVSVENLEMVEISEFSNQLKRAGGVISVDVDYDNFLELTGSLRQDYSSTFGTQTNGFLSYGLGFGISISQLLDGSETAPDNQYLDFKVVGSVGKFGNYYGGNEDYGRYIPSIIGGDGFIISTGFSNPEINNTLRSEFMTAETVQAFDAGIDLRYSRLGIQLNVTYYHESSSNLILVDRLASSTGFEFYESNRGAMTNQGVDISLAIKPLSLEKLNWNIDVAFNKNVNTVTNIGEFNSEIDLVGFIYARSVAIEGQPYGVIFGNGFLRNDDGAMIIGNDGFPISDDDLKIIADPNPDWTMYINNTLNIGNRLSLTALVDIKQGGEMYCGTCGTLDYLGKSQQSADERGASTVFEGVTELGNVNSTSVELAPAYGSNSDYYRVRYGFGGLAEMSIYDASWVRLRSISIGYELADHINLNFIKSLSLSLFAENLFVVTDYPGIDPETNLSGNAGGLGMEYYNNPGTKRYGLSLKASF